MMTDVIATNRNTAILGMGATGLSAARFLSSIGKPFVFADSRAEPPRLSEDVMRAISRCVHECSGAFAEQLAARLLIRLMVSPGVSLARAGTGGRPRARVLR